MEFMATTFPTVQDEAAIAKGKVAVGLSCRNFIGQDTAHGVFAIVRNDALAEIHHATTFGNDVPSSFGKVLDGFATSLIGNQCFEMFLGITAGEVEKLIIDI